MAAYTLRDHKRDRRQTLAAACEPLERRALLSLAVAGPEFGVNGTTVGTHSNAAVATDGDGDFVVAWAGYGGGDNYGIFARRYNAAGAAQGGEFRANAFTTNTQSGAAVAMDADGDFVIAWESLNQDGSSFGVYAQRFSAAGIREGGEFRVNTHTLNNQMAASVAMDAAGNFVVAWISQNQEGPSNHGIYAQRYDYDGVPRGGEFLVNQSTPNTQLFPAVAMDLSGDFVVAWHSEAQEGPGSGYGVYGRRFDRSGAAQGNEFRVNTFTTDNQQLPAVATDAAGAFVVAWQSTAQDGSAYGVYAQRYDAAGVPQGVEFRANTFTTNNQANPAVAMDADGDFVIAWGGNEQESPGFNPGVVAQAYDRQGNELPRPLSAPAGAGNEFRVNTYTTGIQMSPALAMDHRGDVVIAWDGAGATDPQGVFAQRYGESTDTAAPVIGAVFVNGERLAPYALLNPPLHQQIVVTFSEGVAGANVPSGWTLTRNGADVTGEIASFAYAVNPVSGRVEVTLNLAPSYASGNFNLTARDTITDPAGNALDGDVDGTPGGNFTVPFSVAVNGPQSEFRVNTFTTTAQPFQQDRPDVGTDAAGNFVVVWQSAQDGPGPQPGFQIYGQRYNAAGVRQGGEFRVNQFTTLYGTSPDVAVEPDGDFIVAWDGYDVDSFGVRARRFNAAGVPQGAEVTVNTFTPDAQSEPAVAVDGTGNFVIAWESSGQDGSGNGIYAQRYNSAGGRQGTEFRVNQVTFDNQSKPDASMDGNGDFVITWASFGQDGSGDGVYARRYNSFGTAQGAEVRVNSHTTGWQQLPKVDMNSSGSFVITWVSFDQDGSSTGVYAQRYTATGFPLGGEFRVNTYTTGDQFSPDVALEDGGSFVVTWESRGQDGDSDGVFAQRFNSSGVPRGREFRVNNHTTFAQGEPAVAFQPLGDFVVAWTGHGPLGNGIYAARVINEELPTVGAFADSPDPISQGNQLTLRAGLVTDDGAITSVSFYRESNGVAGLQSGFQGDTLVGTATTHVALQWSVDITTAGLNPGTYTYWAQATDDSGLTGTPASTTNAVTDQPAPMVMNSVFRYATLPHALLFTFSEDVSASLGLDDFVIVRVPGGQQIGPQDLTWNAATNTATMTFDNPLQDGRYRATVLAAGVTNPAGVPLQADHVFEFTFLRGDANGDGRVNLNDFNILAANFGQSPRNFTQGDFDYNGIVNLVDFNLLASRFGQAVGAQMTGRVVGSDEPGEAELRQRLGDLLA